MSKTRQRFSRWRIKEGKKNLNGGGFTAINIFAIPTKPNARFQRLSLPGCVCVSVSVSSCLCPAISLGDVLNPTKTLSIENSLIHQFSLPTLSLYPVYVLCSVLLSVFFSLRIDRWLSRGNNKKQTHTCFRKNVQAHFEGFFVEFL